MILTTTDGNAAVDNLVKGFKKVRVQVLRAAHDDKRYKQLGVKYMLDSERVPRTSQNAAVDAIAEGVRMYVLRKTTVAISPAK